jgi:predicted ferric reductase
MPDEIMWYAVRASGLVALGLLTLSAVWGLLLSTRLAGRVVQGRNLAGWHEFLSLLAVGFTLVHMAALLLDSFAGYTVAEVLVPFARGGLEIALGVVATWLLVTVFLTARLRRRLPGRMWRQVHLASFALFWFAALHGIMSGTDAPGTLAGALMLGAVIVVGALTLVRVAQSVPAGRGRAAPRGGAGTASG